MFYVNPDAAGKDLFSRGDSMGWLAISKIV
jgi:hypothetical protein